MELEATLLLLQTSNESLVAVDLLLSNVPKAQRVLAASARTAQPTTMGIWQIKQHNSHRTEHWQSACSLVASLWCP